jgi:hypothetical protein
VPASVTTSGKQDFACIERLRFDLFLAEPCIDACFHQPAPPAPHPIALG